MAALSKEALISALLGQNPQAVVQGAQDYANAWSDQDPSDVVTVTGRPSSPKYNKRTAQKAAPAPEPATQPAKERTFLDELFDFGGSLIGIDRYGSDEKPANFAQGLGRTVREAYNPGVRFAEDKMRTDNRLLADKRSAIEASDPIAFARADAANMSAADLQDLMSGADTSARAQAVRAATQADVAAGDDQYSRLKSVDPMTWQKIMSGDVSLGTDQLALGEARGTAQRGAQSGLAYAASQMEGEYADNLAALGAPPELVDIARSAGPNGKQAVDAFLSRQKASAGQFKPILMPETGNIGYQAVDEYGGVTTVDSGTKDADAAFRKWQVEQQLAIQRQNAATSAAKGKPIVANDGRAISAGIEGIGRALKTAIDATTDSKSVFPTLDGSALRNLQADLASQNWATTAQVAVSPEFATVRALVNNSLAGMVPVLLSLPGMTGRQIDTEKEREALLNSIAGGPTMEAKIWSLYSTIDRLSALSDNPEMRQNLINALNSQIPAKYRPPWMKGSDQATLQRSVQDAAAAGVSDDDLKFFGYSANQ